MTQTEAISILATVVGKLFCEFAPWLAIGLLVAFAFTRCRRDRSPRPNKRVRRWPWPLNGEGVRK